MDSLRKSKSFSTREDVLPFRDGNALLSDARTTGRRGIRTSSSGKEYKICANYETMFSDTRPRNQIKIKSPSQMPTTIDPRRFGLKEVADMKKMMEVQGSHRTLFYRQPSRKHVSSYSTVVVHLASSKGSPKKVTFGSESEPSIVEMIAKKDKTSMVITLPVKSAKMITKGTQTDFRESETQTLPWRHEILAEGKILDELNALDWFDWERNFPPGIEEVTLIEKARQKLAWENVIARLRGKENESKRKCLVVRMAANETAFREEKIEAINRERIILSWKKMKETREKNEAQLCQRLQRCYRLKRMENDSKIDYWKHQHLRKLRKIKFNRDNSGIKSGKPDLIELHEDKTSELYAPQTRNGENPSRGHEVIDIQCRYLKRYHGLMILERQLTKFMQPKIFGFNFEIASKPKKSALCLREHRLKVLEDLEVGDEDEVPEPLNLKVAVPAPSPEPPLPRVKIQRTDSEENLYQASLVLRKIIKGRSIQTQKFLEFMENKKS